MQIEPQTGDTIALMKTNMGEIKILIYTDLAPETATNFIEHAEAERYDEVIFHRVIEDFMIQTGDFENMNGTGGYSYKGAGTYLDDEFGEGLTHLKGVLSMANSGPNTGGSQFFIVQNADGTDFLDGKHAVFGIVYEGLGVVDDIAAVETASDKPVEDVVIESIEISTY
ncbi:MAG TPA: peptidylprolyl isomerase [Flavobacteriales bacterium]|nr:peptidylprolyl isomerase [Flavobacteriales bacterium]